MHKLVGASCYEVIPVIAQLCEVGHPEYLAEEQEQGLRTRATLRGGIHQGIRELRGEPRMLSRALYSFGGEHDRPIRVKEKRFGLGHHPGGSPAGYLHHHDCWLGPVRTYGRRRAFELPD